MVSSPISHLYQKSSTRKIQKTNKKFRNLFFIGFSLILLGICMLYGIHSYVKYIGNKRILTWKEATTLSNTDCILVLGCLVKENGTPSDMLTDRLNTGIALYQAGTAPKLLMSGDHGRKEYDEVSVMKQYAINAGVLSSDIFMDHAGFSTYESIYRAKEIFGVKKVLIVTQEYHLYRALYVAQQFGIDAYGVSADNRTYVEQTMREGREVLARIKDFGMALFRPKPTYLGEAISVSGNGDITNDK